MIGLLPMWQGARAIDFAVQKLGLQEVSLSSMRLYVEKQREKDGEYYVPLDP